MSDLVGGGPMSAASNGRGGNGNGNVRPQFTPPVTTSSPSGIRGPRDIMRDRQARQERRELQEKENLERARAEDEARLAEEEKRKSAERRANAAGAANVQRGSGEAGQRVSGGTAGQRISDNSVRSDRRSGDRIPGDPNQPLQGYGRGGTAVGGGNTGSARPRPTQPSQARPEQGESSRTRPTPQVYHQPDIQDTTQAGYQANQPDASANSGAGFASTEQTLQDSTAATRSSFPHAFERWETLSAHWEGLTSFWIRRLEENSREIARDPLSSQLSRQVTDLSAAGANLFHAVVELQRLRASSERKFQRWFFETRAEQERFREIQALCTNSLEEERALRNAAQAKIIELEDTVQTLRLQKEQGGSDKQVAELRRELQISKEEARRAWEELGRREQEERERTASLRDGQPTLVGGVQVVPMMQGVPSRHGSTRNVPPTRDGPAMNQPPLEEEPKVVEDNDVAYQAYSRSQRDPLDPFLEPSTIAPRSASASSSRPIEYTQAPAVQPTASSAFYQQGGTTVHPSERIPRSGSAFSEEEEYEIDARGDFIRDDKGNKVRYRAPASDADTDEYDVAADREREIANRQRYGQVTRQPEYAGQIVSQAGSSTLPAVSEPEYTGQGYGSGPGWEAVPRHHHPTRLSDVLEEDERSRTSASQISRRE